MTLLHLFLLHRYKTTSVYYLSPTEDNTSQAQRMKALRLFSDINIEIGHIIVAHVNRQRVNELLNADGVALADLIHKAESGSLAAT
jgi:isocitrate lyase